MFANLDFGSIVDLGFVILVTGSCIATLMKDDTKSEQRSRKFTRELQELQTSIRELIGQAATASSNLDRSLVRRKVELETLMKRIDELQKQGGLSEQIEQEVEERPVRRRSANGSTGRTAKKPTPQYSSAVQRGAERANLADDFPNASWIEREESSNIDAEDSEDSMEDAEDLARAASSEGDSGWLEVLSEEQDDTVTLSSTLPSRSEATSPKRQAAPARKPVHGAQNDQRLLQRQELAQRIEVENDEIHSSEEQVRARFLDPTVYNIARRLLLGGKEIHVVARKLDLPVAEVRMIDTSIRRAQERAPEPIAAPTTRTNGKAKPQAKASNGVSSRSTARREVRVQDLDESVDEPIIRRAQALL